MGLRREPLVHDGIFKLPLPADQGLGLGKPLKLLTKPERSEIPLCVAALGDKNVEMTAEFADGWLPFLFLPEKAHDGLGRRARARARPSAPPTSARCEISAGGMVAIGDDVKGLLDFAAPDCTRCTSAAWARAARTSTTSCACQYGYEKEAKEIQDLYLDGNKRDAEAKVPMEWLEAGNLVGPASYVKERIAAFAEAGVTNLQVFPASADPAATIAQIKELVS